jgi:hypothetical protein
MRNKQEGGKTEATLEMFRDSLLQFDFILSAHYYHPQQAVPFRSGHQPFMPVDYERIKRTFFAKNH